MDKEYKIYIHACPICGRANLQLNNIERECEVCGAMMEREEEDDT